MEVEGLRLGIDVGGTFTDFFLHRGDGTFRTLKVPSSPSNPADAVISGLEELATLEGLDMPSFMARLPVIVHGTTVTTNTLLTCRGARVALFTTEGFRDALEMRRGLREHLYDNRVGPPEPLVPRFLRFPIKERIDYNGKVLIPIEKASVETAIDECASQGIEAIAIGLMHSYANSSHEEETRKVCQVKAPGVHLSLSSQILPEVGFYKRISTTVVNAYVGRLLESYLCSLKERLQALGFKGSLLIMQSNAGLVSPEVATLFPVTTLISGPAAGPLAAMSCVRSCFPVQGDISCITMDMGGTSFDCSLITGSRVHTRRETTVGGNLVAVPMLAIHTIGAGGGSIGWVDQGGLLRVGPQSAGAAPGPACYGRGGDLPTCTDADLVLGYLNPDYFLGGMQQLKIEAAQRAIYDHICRATGLTLEEAALGMYKVINSNMANAIREVSVKEGFDPREFPLVVGGGAGPVHAGAIAGELGIPLLLVPQNSSVFCALGMLYSDFTHQFVRTHQVPLQGLNPRALSAAFEEMKEEANAMFEREQVPAQLRHSQYLLDMRYLRQYHTVTVESQWEEWAYRPQELAARFHEQHRRLYGFSLPGAEVEILTIQLVAIGAVPKPVFKSETYHGPSGEHAVRGHRQAFVPERNGFSELPVFDGLNLRYGNLLSGSAIIELPYTTVLVPLGYRLVCDQAMNFLIFREDLAKELESKLNIPVAP